MSEIQSLEEQQILCNFAQRQLEIDREEYEIKKRRAAFARDAQDSQSPTQPDDVHELERRDTLLNIERRRLQIDIEDFEIKKQRAKLEYDTQTSTSQYLIDRQILEERETLLSFERRQLQIDLTNFEIQRQRRTQLAVASQTSITPALDRDEDMTTEIESEAPTQHTAVTSGSDETLEIPKQESAEPEKVKPTATLEKRLAKLFRQHRCRDDNKKLFDPWTSEKFWSEVVKPLVVQSSRVLDAICACRAELWVLSGLEWTPLETLQRAQFISILRQGGLYKINRRSGREIKCVDLENSVKLRGQELYEQREAISQEREFQKILENNSMVLKSGLYWHMGVVPKNYENIIKHGGRFDGPIEEN